MECSNMNQYGSFAEPRISFSSGFAASSKHEMIKYKEEPVSSDDFEFGVKNFSMVTSADEIFFDGMILPLKEEVNNNTSKRLATLREELNEEGDEDSPRSKSWKGSWRERLRLGFVRSKKDHHKRSSF